MTSNTNPKTGAAFTKEEEKQRIKLVKSHKLLHNSAYTRKKLTGLSLPEGKAKVKDCTIAELKKMIFTHGG